MFGAFSKQQQGALKVHYSAFSISLRGNVQLVESKGTKMQTVGGIRMHQSIPHVAILSKEPHSMVSLADLMEDVMSAVKLDTEQLAAQSEATKLM